MTEGLEKITKYPREKVELDEFQIPEGLDKEKSELARNALERVKLYLKKVLSDGIPAGIDEKLVKKIAKFDQTIMRKKGYKPSDFILSSLLAGSSIYKDMMGEIKFDTDELDISKFVVKELNF